LANFTSIIVPLLRANSAAYITLDATRQILNFTLPNPNPILSLAQPLVHQPSKVENDVVYQIDYPETVIFSLPSELMEDGSSFNNVAHFVVRPNPSGDMMKYQTDPLLLLPAGVTEDAIRWGQKVLELTLAHDRFVQPTEPVAILTWPYGNISGADRVAESLFTSDTGTFPSVLELALKLAPESENSIRVENGWKLYVTIPILGDNYTVNSVTGVEIVEASISVKALPRLISHKITERGLVMPSIVRFMIRRPPPLGTLLELERGRSTWYWNWNVGEVNEWSLKYNGMKEGCEQNGRPTGCYYVDLNMTDNTFYRTLDKADKQVLLTGITFDYLQAFGMFKARLESISTNADATEDMVEQLSDRSVRWHMPFFPEIGMGFYDITFPETISIEIPAELTSKQTSHPFADVIVRPLPKGTLFTTYPLLIQESRIREGGYTNTEGKWIRNTMIFEVGGEARGHTSLHKTNPLGETLDRMKVKLEFNDTAQSQGWEQSLKPALVHPLYMSHFTVTDLTIEMEMPICDGDPAKRRNDPKYILLN